LTYSSCKHQFAFYQLLLLSIIHYLYHDLNKRKCQILPSLPQLRPYATVAFGLVHQSLTATPTSRDIPGMADVMDLFVIIKTYGIIRYNFRVMWVKTMSFLPPMAGNGKHTTYKHGDDWGMVYCCFTRIKARILDISYFFQNIMDTEEALNPNKFWACLMQKVFTRVK
jgi:hypothetical protein